MVADDDGLFRQVPEFQQSFAWQISNLKGIGLRQDLNPFRGKAFCRAEHHR